MNFEELVRLHSPYSLAPEQKQSILEPILAELTAMHRMRCPEYANILSVMYPLYGSTSAGKQGLSSIPWLPVSLFKNMVLSSVENSNVFRTLVSSGTTGQQLSRITLDRQTADRQAQALAHIMKALLGPDRLPMLLIDSSSAISKNSQINARTTGLLGMMQFGRDHLFALTDDFIVERAALETWLHKHKGRRLFVFGFTFMLWRHFYQQLQGSGFDLSNAIVVHGGGWKKLQQEQVSDNEFRQALRTEFGIEHVHNFYGMVEQVGSIFMQSSDGYLYAPDFADLIVRDPITWEPANNGEEGVIQVMSILPLSYPGHSLLTEDVGTAYGDGVSPEGWRGRRLKISGRVPKAELRGCSDVLAAAEARRQIHPGVSVS